MIENSMLAIIGIVIIVNMIVGVIPTSLESLATVNTENWTVVQIGMFGVLIIVIMYALVMTVLKFTRGR